MTATQKPSNTGEENPIEPEQGYRLLALFFPIKKAHYNDFHWCRKDDDDRWSQKRGFFQAQEIDDAGDLIYDPKRASDTHYKFHSFFLVPRKKIVLSRSEEFGDRGIREYRPLIEPGREAGESK